ncbi:MAG: hypothetical protein H6P98_3071 [Candidatus Aminicenantes bacterium]|nr:hypothetical protein [Candidatus Aminicenantes bacterium]
MKKTVVFLAIGVFLCGGLGFGATKYLDLSWAEFLAGSYVGSANNAWGVNVADYFKYIPVHFPEQTGTVTYLKAWLTDSSASYKLLLKLFRVNLSTGEKALVFQINTGAAQAVGKKEYITGILQTAGADTIDSSTYGWFLLVEGDNDSATFDLLKFHGVRITYDAL